MADESELAAKLTLVAKHARALRDSGVSSVSIGDVSFVLIPAQDDGVAIQLPAEATPSALNDPTSYGWSGGLPPGFERPKE